MAKLVVVYKRGNVYYITGCHLTYGGIYCQAGPAYAVRVGDKLELNKSIASALEAWQGPIATPRYERLEDNPLIRLAKVKSFTGFLNKSKMIEIIFEDNLITLRPNRFLGPRKGFEGLDKKSTIHATYDLASTAEEAFGRCE